MTPLAVAVLLTSSVALSASPALALTRAETAAQNVEQRQENREARKVEIIENAEQRQENRQENRDERQDNRQERRDDFAQRHATRLSNRFGFYYDRLSTIMSKIETRFANLSEDGKDMSAAQAKLAEAKTALSSAKSYSDQAIAGFEAIVPAEYESQRTQALAARDLANNAREQFKLAVSLMKEAVQLAKKA